MALQDHAISIIEKVAAKIEKLLYQHGFDKKIRTSDESIFAEKIFYQKEEFELAIVACVHPHDYPYSLSVRFIKKIPYAYEYMGLFDLINISNKTPRIENDELLIATDDQIESTIQLFYELLKTILEENLLNYWRNLPK